MRQHRWWALIAVLALVAGACATEPAETTAGPEETTTTAEPGTTAAPEETTTTVAAETPYEHLNQALAGEFAGRQVEIIAQWLPGSSEADNFDTALQPFRDQTGIDVAFEPTPEYETALQVRVDGGNPPDLAQIAQPGKMQQYAAAGKLVNLSEWFNVDQLENDLVGGFVELGSHQGDVYGVFYKTDVKSIVWYPIQAFADNGYEVPTTWDELIALSDQIIADGNGNPWCVSIESQAADGWVATDWIEDVLLRTAPPETYAQWYNHEIAFDDPAVVNATNIVGDIWFTPEYAYGGNVYINNTWIGETQDPMFAEGGPECWMQKQAAWIPGFWGANRDFPDDPTAWPNQPGEDVGFFYLPPIDEAYGKPVLGSGDMFVMFDDRPEVRALLEFLATPEGAKGWIDRGGFLSPNKNVPLEWYTTYPHNELAQLVAEATTFGFDASDLMPAEVGAGTFWSGMVEWVAANGEGTEEVLGEIEETWPTD